MKQRPSLDEIFGQAPEQPTRPSLEQIFSSPVESTLQSDMQARGAKFADIASSKDNMASKAFQMAGNEVGAVADAGGRLVNNAGKAIYSTFSDKAKERINSDIERLKASPIGQGFTKGMKAYGENLAAYDQANPEVGRNFEAAREFGNLIPFGSSAVRNVAGDIVGTGGKALGNVMKDTAGGMVNKIKPSAPLPVYEDVKALSQASYKKADELGGIFKPEIREKFIRKIQENLPGDEKLMSGATTIQKIFEGATEKRGKSLTLEGLEQIDKELTDLKYSEVHPNGKPTAEGQRISSIQAALREAADSAAEDSVVGGKNGYRALRNGIANWNASRKIYEVNKIFERASMMDNEAISIKAGFRNLYLNDKKLIGYSETEKKLIKAAGQSTAAANLLRSQIGSRLISSIIGAAAGSAGGMPGTVGGAALGAATGGTARAIAASLQQKQGEKVLREIGRSIEEPRVVYKYEKKPTLALPAPKKDPIFYGPGQRNVDSAKLMQNIKDTGRATFPDYPNVQYSSFKGGAPEEFLQLPAPGKEPFPDIKLANRKGDIYPMSRAESYKFDKARQESNQIGITQDVRATQIRNQINKAYEQRDLKRNAQKEAQIAEIALKSSVPVEQLVDMADKNIKELADILGKKGGDTAFAQALRIAIKNKKKR